jgi:hypothetical protein
MCVLSIRSEILSFVRLCPKIGSCQTIREVAQQAQARGFKQLNSVGDFDSSHEGESSKDDKYEDEIPQKEFGAARYAPQTCWTNRAFAMRASHLRGYYPW